MNKFLSFLVFVATPLTMLYGLIASFYARDIWAMVIMSISALVIMFAVGKCHKV